MVRRHTNKKGGMIGMLTAAALRYGIPAAVSYLKSKGKKSRKGKGMKQLGTSKGCCHTGRGMRQLGRGKRGGNFWNNIKKAAKTLYEQPEVQALVKKGKEYARRNIRYAITNPVQSYNNVRKFFGKGHGGRRTLRVKGYGRMPKRSASVAGVHSASGPGLITMSRRMPPRNSAKTAPNSVIKRQIRRTY